MYNLKFVEENIIDKVAFEKKVEQNIIELENHMFEYDGKVIHQTLISSGFGQYANEMFLEMVGEDKDTIDRVKESFTIEDYTIGKMQELTDDFNTYKEEECLEMDGYSFIVEFNETDGAIELFIVADDWDDYSSMGEEEYSKIYALKEEFCCELSEVIDTGNNEYQVQGDEYLVLTEEEADEKVVEEVEEMLWAFNPSFLADLTDLPEEVFQALSEKCEDGNEAIKRIVERCVDGGVKEVAEEAVRYDGRGHYLNRYNGEEIEISVDGTTYFVYRQN